jgi:hypothetical protein
MQPGYAVGAPPSRCTIHKLAIDVNVAKREIVYVLDNIGFGYAFKIAVGERDTFDRRILESTKV